MPRRISLLAALLAAIVSLAQGARAEDLTVSLPDDVKFALRLDVPAIRNSAVGGKLFAATKEKVLQEIAEKGEGGGLTLDKIAEILGFDPFEEIQAILVAASDYESPEKSLIACVQMRKTTGNLEGLLLTLPGYNVEEYHGTQIHSATPEEGQSVFAAIHTGKSGNRIVLLAARRDPIVRMFDELDGKASSGGKNKSMSLASDGKSLVALNVFELPKDIAEEEGPPANVAKIVRSASARVSESDGKLNLAVNVATEAQKQAEQLGQMVKGLTAMLDLAASSDEDEDLKAIQHLTAGLTVKQDGPTLELNLSVPVDQVQSLIEKNLLDQD